MNKKDRISSIEKSSSFELLRTQSTLNNSILTSAKNREETPRPFYTSDRRKSRIPTPYKPRVTKKSVSMSGEEDKFILKEQNTYKTDQKDDTHIKSSFLEVAGIDDETSRKTSDMSDGQVNDRSLKPTTHVDNVDDKNSDLIDVERIVNSKTKISFKAITKEIDVKNSSDESDVDTASQSEQDNTDDNFDTFILEHFIPFSGRQNVARWLDETETKFRQFRISRTSRFEAISLLADGDAKRMYIKHRKNIQSFDDFYEFLLINFDSSETSQGNISQKQPDIFALPNLINQSSVLSSGNIVDHGSTTLVGTTFATQSTTIPNNTSTFMPDDTMSDLHKAIVGNLIKNPKTFKGGKDDVKNG